MASVIRPTYSKVDPVTGQRKRWASKVWYARYYDHMRRKWRKKKGYADKAMTLQLACRLERETAAAREGIGPDPDSEAGDLSALINTYVNHLVTKGSSHTHVHKVQRDLERVVESKNWRSLGDITSEGLVDFLSAQLSSARTWNRVAGSWFALTKWLMKRSKLMSDPLHQVPKQNEQVDRRLVRRTITNEELERLVSTVVNAGPNRRLTGKARAFLYQMAVSTGYRAAELASLTPASFDLDSNPPMVHLQGGSSKRRKADSIPLHPTLVPVVQSHLEHAGPGKLWPGPWWQQAALMIRRDLKAAGIPFVDAAGRVFDFHALRMQFVTTLARRGVQPAVLRELARHSSIDLTLKVYTDLGIDHRAAAIGLLSPPTTTSGRVTPCVTHEREGTGTGGNLAAESPRL
jgi:integrase